MSFSTRLENIFLFQPTDLNQETIVSYNLTHAMQLLVRLCNFLLFWVLFEVFSLLQLWATDRNMNICIPLLCFYNIFFFQRFNCYLVCKPIMELCIVSWRVKTPRQPCSVVTLMAAPEKKHFLWGLWHFVISFVPPLVLKFFYFCALTACCLTAWSQTWSPVINTCVIAAGSSPWHLMVFSGC